MREIRRVVRVTYDEDADAAYIYLTDSELPAVRDTVAFDPPGVIGFTAAADWKDERLAGIEIQGASKRLFADLLVGTDADEANGRVPRG